MKHNKVYFGNIFQIQRELLTREVENSQVINIFFQKTQLDKKSKTLQIFS